MPKVAILLADGFETVEALTVADLLRRAGIKARLISTMGTPHVITGQQIQIIADKTIDTLDTSVATCYVIPGGMPAVKRLIADDRVGEILTRAMENPAITVAASCAGPVVLAELGLLEGRHVTVFPGCEDLFPDDVLVDEPVVVDGDLITARSTGCSLQFAITIVEELAGPEAARKVVEGVGVV